MAYGSSAPRVAHTEPPTSGTPALVCDHCHQPGCTSPDCRRVERGAEIDWWRKASQPARWTLGKAAV